MNALVTGGTGFLGRHLVARLLADGWRVRCLVRGGSDVEALRAAVPAGAGDRLEFFSGSLGDPASCADAVAGCSYVFHLAAEMRGAIAVLFLTNVVGTRNLLRAATNAEVARFVLVSSLAVYDSGRLPRWDCLDENCPIEPSPHLRDGYTYSKVVQERVAWEAHRDEGLPLVVIRPGVIYGPGRDCLSARVGLKLGSVVIAMGGSQLMPYTHVENCARAIALAGSRPGVVGQAFNVIDDDPPTGRGLFRQYRRTVGGVRKVPIPGWLVPTVSGLCEWYHRRSRGQLPAVLTRYKSRAMWKPLRYSNAKAKAALGWRPEKSFTEGLRETLARLSRRPAAPNTEKA